MSNSGEVNVNILLDDGAVEARVLRRYALNARCLVLAGYKGATVRYLLDHGAKHVLTTEPQEWALNILRRNVAAGGDAYEGRVHADEYAIVPWETAAGSKIMLHRYWTDGASMTLPLPFEDDAVEVPAMSVDRWLGSTQFDFAVLNCEGAEYMLLPYISDLCTRVLVQFHGPGAAPMPAEMLSLQRRVFIGRGWYLYS